MKILPNFLLFSIFTLLVSLATFYPLSFLRVASSDSQTSVLGESIGPYSLDVAGGGSIPVSVVSVSGSAYRGQNSYFNGAFKIENNSDEIKNYKLSVLKVTPVGEHLTVSALGPFGEVVTVGPHEGVLANVIVKSTQEGELLPIKFIAQIAIIPLN